jgi:hypothetical protein
MIMIAQWYRDAEDRHGRGEQGCGEHDRDLDQRGRERLARDADRGVPATAGKPAATRPADRVVRQES